MQIEKKQWFVLILKIQKVLKRFSRTYFWYIFFAQLSRRDILEIRNKICADTEIVVLTNATQIHKEAIIQTLSKIDRCMFKLDSGIESTINKINMPAQPVNISSFIKNVKQN